MPTNEVLKCCLSVFDEYYSCVNEECDCPGFGSTTHQTHLPQQKHIVPKCLFVDMNVNLKA